MFSGIYLSYGTYALPLFTDIRDVNLSSAKILKVTHKDTGTIYYARAISDSNTIRYNLANRNQSYDGETTVKTDRSTMDINGNRLTTNIDSDYNQCTRVTYDCNCAECVTEQTSRVDDSDSAKVWTDTHYYHCNCHSYKYEQIYQSQCRYDTSSLDCSSPTGFIKQANIIRTESSVASECNCQSNCQCNCCCNAS